jgi:hypothetical protein
MMRNDISVIVASLALRQSDAISRGFPHARDTCDKPRMPRIESRNARPPRRGAVKLSELVGKAIAPLAGRRGFATADLIAAWPTIAGTRFSDCTRPEKLQWPRGSANDGKSASLIVRVDGPRAVLFQHEAGQIIERVNTFLGYAAVSEIRIVQGPVEKDRTKATPSGADLSPEAEARLGAAILPVESDPLRSALGRLGRNVLREQGR